MKIERMCERWHSHSLPTRASTRARRRAYIADLKMTIGSTFRFHYNSSLVLGYGVLKSRIRARPARVRACDHRK